MSPSATCKPAPCVCSEHGPHGRRVRWRAEVVHRQGSALCCITTLARCVRSRLSAGLAMKQLVQVRGVQPSTSCLHRDTNLIPVQKTSRRTACWDLGVTGRRAALCVDKAIVFGHELSRSPPIVTDHASMTSSCSPARARWRLAILMHVVIYAGWALRVSARPACSTSAIRCWRQHASALVAQSHALKVGYPGGR